MQLLVLLPSHNFEGSPVLTNRGAVALPFVTDVPVAVTLSSSDETEVKVSASVIIPAGESAARFDVAAQDDAETDGRQQATITAAAPGFANGTAALEVLDNDPARFDFASVTSPRIAGELFPIEVLARDVNGELVSGTRAGVLLRAEGQSGPAPLTGQTNATFVEGRWAGQIAVATADTGVRLMAEQGVAQGESAPFNVLSSPVVGESSIRTLDLAWDAARQRLLASVAAEDSAYSNQFVVLDPTNGSVLKAIPAGPFITPLGFTLVREGRLLVEQDDSP